MPQLALWPVLICDHRATLEPDVVKLLSPFISVNLTLHQSQLVLLRHPGL